MAVYVNRVLNMKKIKAIGFDMDYTLVRYHTENFEELTYNIMVKKLVEDFNYPKELYKLKFDFNKVIQGLVLDLERGNILKLSRFGKVKSSAHGTKQISFYDQKSIYENKVVDLTNTNFQSLDTSFSISHGVLYSQLVDLKDETKDLPDYKALAQDVRKVLDIGHRDGSIKDQVRDNIEKYIIKDPKLPELLEKYKESGKKLIIITNSDFNYTKLLMDYSITPFLKKHNCWSELFDITVTLASKPKFFVESPDFFKIPMESFVEDQPKK